MLICPGPGGYRAEFLREMEKRSSRVFGPPQVLELRKIVKVHSIIKKKTCLPSREISCSHAENPKTLPAPECPSPQTTPSLRADFSITAAPTVYGRGGVKAPKREMILAHSATQARVHTILSRGARSSTKFIAQGRAQRVCRLR